jgi:hypothetical protein
MSLPLLAFALSLLPTATSTLTAEGCSLGEIYVFSQAECRITLHNAEDRPVAVQLNAQGSTMSPSSLTVPAKGSAGAVVRVDVGNAAGRLDRAVRIHPERGVDAFAWTRGFALSALDDPYPQIDFGTVEVASKPAERSFELVSHDAASFRIVRVLDHPEGVDVSIDPNGHVLHISPRADIPLGILDGDIKLSIDTPHQHEAWVHVSGDVHGDISIENNPYWFGSVEAGAGRTVLIPLKSRAGRELHLGTVHLEMVKGNVDVVPCEPAAPSCKAIRLVFDDTQRAGLTRAKLDVELPELHRQMKVRIWGILQNSATPAAERGMMPMPPEADISAPWTEGIVDSVNAPVYAVPTDDPLDVERGPPPPTEPPPGSGPLLKWGTTDEKGAYGYQVFRGDAESGPFVLQNPQVIRVHAKEYASVPYFWRDDHTTKGQTYWYYVGVVYKDGHKQALSTPRSKVAQ